MDEEERRDGTEFEDDPLYEDLCEDDPLYEDDSDGGIPLGSVARGCANAPPCLIAVIALVSCLFVALHASRSSRS